MKRLLALTLPIMIATGVCGCWDLRSLDELALIVGPGVDLAPNGQDLTVTVARAVFDELKSENTQVLAVEASSVEHALFLLEAQLNKRLALGHLQTVAFGEGFCRSRRLRSVAQSVMGHSDTPPSAAVVAVQGLARDLLSQHPQEQDMIGVHVKKLVGNAHLRGLEPAPSLYDAVRARPLNKDLWLPLTRVEDRRVMLVGSLVFRKDTATTILSPQETAQMVLLGACPARRRPYLAVGIEVLGQLYAVQVRSSRLRWHRTITSGRLNIEVVSDVRVIAPRLPRTGMDERDGVRIISEAVSSELTLQGNALLARLQKDDVDPLGLTSPDLFSSKGAAQQYRRMYSSADISYRAKVRVDAIGGNT
jgi:hypothetical protein